MKKNVLYIVLVFSLGLVAACSNSVSEDSDESIVPPCKTGDVDNCEYGTLADSRDGQVYKTVKIGDQWWMAENLKYKTCDQKYYEPGIYFWKTAQKVCPPGWHLPSRQEVEVLFASVGGDSVAGRKLSARDTSHGGMFSGTDEYGFSAFNVTTYFEDEPYEKKDFWTSTAYIDTIEDIEDYFGFYLMNYLEYSPEAGILDFEMDVMVYPVRCVMNDSGDSDEFESFRGAEAECPERPVEAGQCRWTDEWREWNSCFYDLLTDERDGQVYKTVKIADQWWMAENLNFRYLQKTDSLDSSSFCLNDSLAYCEKYGRLYLWSAAMDSAALYSTNAEGCGFGTPCAPESPVRGVCPAGWHIPSKDEWDTLYRRTYPKELYDIDLIEEPYNGYTLMFDDGRKGYGHDCKDRFGFNALSAGHGWAGGPEYSADGATMFWSSTINKDKPDSLTHVFVLGDDESGTNASIGDRRKLYSVRCIKD